MMYHAPRPLYDHQITAAREIMDQHGRGLLHHEMGTGKTATAITVAGALATRELIDNVLVICPLNAIPIWSQEIETWYSGLATIKLVLAGQTSTRETETFNGSPPLLFTVTTYDLMVRRDIMPDPNTFVIMDECQKIKGAGTRRSRHAARMGLVTTHRLGLSGTPAPQGPLDYYGIFRFIEPRLFPMTWTKFRQKYATWLPYPRQYIRKDYQNLDDLKDRVGSITHSVSKADCLDLPPKTRQIVDVTLRDDARRIYHELEKNFITQLPEGPVIVADHGLVRLTRLSQVTGGFVNDTGGKSQPISNAKISALCDLVEPLLDAKERITIFARFRAEVADIEKTFKTLGVHVGTIKGGDSSDRREQACEEYLTHDGPTILVCSLGAASEAINLSGSAYTIFYSLDFDLSHVEQADARNDRPGQTRPMTTYFLLASKTVDHYMYDAVVHKRRLQDWIGGFVDDLKAS